MTDATRLSITVDRSTASIATIVTTSASHRETFVVAAGQHTLAITVVDEGESSLPEPRVHVVHRPHDWSFAPTGAQPPTEADNEELLVRVWQLIGSG